MEIKRKITLLLAGFVLSQILWSCSSVKLAHIEKRRYMDGYHVDLGNRNINKKQSRIHRIKKVKSEKTHAGEFQKYEYLTHSKNVLQNDLIEERSAQHSKAISRLHKKIRSSISNALAHNSNKKSIHKINENSKGLNLMIIGGIMILAAIVLLPFYFGFLNYLLMLGGFALGVIGLLIYLEVIDI